jgi:ketosteroid isomerase-like protein
MFQKSNHIMKKLLLTASLILTVFILNAQQNKQEIASKLKAMEVSWNKAYFEKDHGVKVFNEIIADDFLSTGSDGLAHNKAQLIKSETETKNITTSVDLGPMTVNFYGNNIASVTGSHTAKGKNEKGQAFNKKYAWTDVYMERNGKWQCIASGTTLFENK